MKQYGYLFRGRSFLQGEPFRQSINYYEHLIVALRRSGKARDKIHGYVSPRFI